MLRQTMLTVHNAARASVRVPALAWDDTLASESRRYAEELARTGKFEHSTQPRGHPHQGENLWTGTRDAYRYDEMAGHWIAEKKDFVNRPTPGFSRTGNYRDAVHYAGIVWSRTTHFGCATASNREDDYLVCRYRPAGNVMGAAALP